MGGENRRFNKLPDIAGGIDPGKADGIMSENVNKEDTPTIECPHCDTKMEAGKGCCKVKLLRNFD